MITWIKGNLNIIIPAIISLLGVLVNVGLIILSNNKIRKYYDLENRERTNNIIHRLILRYLNEIFPQELEMELDLFIKSIKTLARNHGDTYTRKQILRALSNDFKEKPIKIDFINKKIKRNYMTDAEIAESLKNYSFSQVKDKYL